MIAIKFMSSCDDVIYCAAIEDALNLFLFDS